MERASAAIHRPAGQARGVLRASWARSSSRKLRRRSFQPRRSATCFKVSSKAKGSDERRSGAFPRALGREVAVCPILIRGRSAKRARRLTQLEAYYSTSTSAPVTAVLTTSRSNRLLISCLAEACRRVTISLDATDIGDKTLDRAARHKRLKSTVMAISAFPTGIGAILRSLLLRSRGRPTRRLTTGPQDGTARGHAGLGFRCTQFGLPDEGIGAMAN